MTDYAKVSDALTAGTEPRLLCATCPWDRPCVTPPSMTRAEIDAQIEQASNKDDAEAKAALERGEKPRMPMGGLLTILAVGGRDVQAAVCPVFALRLRSSAGRGIADSVRASMQGWDDQS